ncbi:hypothetical protein F8388_004685 [Cannabis sativa]|uniref:AP2/ERF domain-containing protein n=1 Tax=Cannabis sativa TaxID=3483 RepID=A0A7J6HN76_CANSA|nr:hypothetical protein F8388_004685 [Cannabis sativa]
MQKLNPKCVPRKSIDTFEQRTSIYRGVTRHRWTGRYEAHLWDNSYRREGQTRKGRQGGYDKEEKAARAYDFAALKWWGFNFNFKAALFGFSCYVTEISVEFAKMFPRFGMKKTYDVETMLLSLQH